MDTLWLRMKLREQSLESTRNSGEDTKMSICCLQKAKKEQREYHAHILELELLNSKSVLNL